MSGSDTGGGTPSATQEQIDALRAGVDAALANIAGEVEAEVYGAALPLVGNGLDGSVAALDAVGSLRAAMLVALDDLGQAGSHAVVDIENALDAALDAAGFTGSAVVELSQTGTLTVALSETVASNWLQAVTPDLGLPGLNIDTSGTVDASADLTLDLSFGVDTAGFFLDTSSASEVTLNLDLDNLDLPDGIDVGLLAFAGADAGSALSGTFAIDLQDGDANGRLRTSEFSGDLVDATLTANSDVVIELTADLGTAALPSLSTQLDVEWDFAGASVTDDASTFGEVPSVSFNDLSVDLGDLVTDVIQPVLEIVDAALAPVRAALTVVNADMTPLKRIEGWRDLFDLNEDGRITLLDLFEMAGVDTGPIAAIARIVEDIADWAAVFTSGDFNPERFDVGSFDLDGQDIRDAAFELSQANVSLENLTGNVFDVIDTLAGGGWDVLDDEGRTGREVLETLVRGDVGIDIPVLTDPAQLVSLLLGRPADLVEVDLPEVTIGFSDPTLVSIPIVPFVEVAFGGSVSATFDIAFGFDSSGFLAVHDDWVGGLTAALDGLYLIDGEGAEVTLSAALSLAGGVGAQGNGLFAGIEVQGTVELDLADQLGAVAGRVYMAELGDALVTNPFSIFDASGAITAGLFIEIVLGDDTLWSLESPTITLASFDFGAASATVEGEGPGLGTLSGDTLTLNIGALAGNRNVPDASDGIERAGIGPGFGASGDVTVALAGTTETFSGVSRVVGDGGAEDDQIVLAADLRVSTDIAGGAGNDILAGALLADTIEGGAGDDVIEGRAGDDTLAGGDGDDVITGGAGADEIDGGEGLDRASYALSDAGVTVNLVTNVNMGGDAEGDTLTSIENVEGSSLDDHLTGGDGGVVLSGRAGDDTLVTGAGNDVLLGNEGDDTLDGGGGVDVMVGGLGDDTYHVDNASDIVDEDRIGELTNAQAAGVDGGYDHVISSVDWSLNTETGAEIEDLTLIGAATDGFGNASDNVITGNDEANNLFGLGGNDVIDGGAGDDVIGGGDGDDTITGGADDDLLDGGDGMDVLDGGVGDDQVHGGAGDDDLTGGTGDDYLVGGAGTDTMRGGIGSDVYVVDSAADVIEEAAASGDDELRALASYALADGIEIETLRVEETVETGLTLEGNAVDQTLIGGIGDDTLIGRGGADAHDGGEGNDVASYRHAAEGVTIDLTLDVQAGGEAEGDTYESIEVIEGSAHADTLLGSATNDVLLGLAGNDVIDGREGADVMHGGAGDDLYIVDSLNDVPDETTGSGHDRVETHLDYSLEPHDGVEDLTILGAATHATGNALDNRLVGNANDNVLDGREGADEMVGGTGDDLYIVDHAGDVAIDTGGHDRILVETAALGGASGTRHFDMSVSATQVEDLNVGDDAANIDVTGNALDNHLVGNGRSNTLRGGEGDDRLVTGAGGTDHAHGEAGDDTAVFASGSTGNMYFYGGEGTDTVVIDWADATVRVSTYLDAVRGDGAYVHYRDVERFDITSGSGSDILYVGDYRDHISTGAGSDYVRIGGGGGSALMGDGHDRLSVVMNDEAGVRTDADVRLVLADTQGAQVVLAEGTDAELTVEGIEMISISTGAGDDLLDTRGVEVFSTANDWRTGLYSGEGDDTFATDHLMTGTAYFYAGDGVDTLIVDWSTSDDRVSTYNGSIRNASTSTYLNYSDVERFDITSGSGSDILTIGAYRDRIDTGAGSDYVRDGGGGGTIIMGDGHDRLHLSLTDEDGNGTDEDIRLVLAETQDGTVTLAEGTDAEVTLGGIEMISFATGAGNDTFDTRGVEVFSTSNDWRTSFNAGAGDDTFATDHLMTGTAYYTAGDGVDTLIVDWETADDRVSIYQNSIRNASTSTYLNYSDVERFDITSGSGSDILDVGTYRDLISTGGGSDYVQDGGGGGALLMGDGHDYLTVVMDDEDGNRTDADIRLVLAETQGNEVVLAEGTAQELTVEGVEMIALSTGAGDDLLDTRGVVVSNSTSSSSPWRTGLYSGEGDDTFATDHLMTGNSYFYGGGGDDTLIIDWSLATGRVNTYAGAVRSGDFSSNVHYDDVENFHITSGSGSDILYVEGGDDIIRTGAGTDYVRGDAGDDLIEGGSGGDQLSGGADIDTLSYETSDAGITVDLSTNAASGGHAEGDAISGFENLIGSAHDDAFVGSAADNVIDGGAGDDTVTVAGALAGHEIEAVMHGLVVRDIDESDGDGGTDTVRNVERIVFDDGTATLRLHNGMTVIDLRDMDDMLLARQALTEDGRNFSIDYSDGAPTGAIATDADNAFGWDTITTEYAEGVISGRTVTFDDGRVRVETHENGLLTHAMDTDPDNAVAWSSIESTYDAGDLTGRTITFDNGRILAETRADGERVSTLDTDGNHAFAWTSITGTYTDGALSERAIVFDNGRERLETWEDGDLIGSIDTDAGEMFAWASIATTFENRAVTGRTIAFDNGRERSETFTGNGRTATDTDVTNLFAWETIETSFDAANAITGRALTFDDGRVRTDIFEDGAWVDSSWSNGDLA